MLHGPPITCRIAGARPARAQGPRRRATKRGRMRRSAREDLTRRSYDEAMTPARHATTRHDGAWWRAAAALAWVAGVALQLQQPALWGGAAYPLMLASGLAVLLAASRTRRPWA